MLLGLPRGTKCAVAGRLHVFYINRESYMYASLVPSLPRSSFFRSGGKKRSGYAWKETSRDVQRDLRHA